MALASIAFHCVVKITDLTTLLHILLLCTKPVLHFVPLRQQIIWIMIVIPTSKICLTEEKKQNKKKTHINRKTWEKCLLGMCKLNILSILLTVRHFNSHSFAKKMILHLFLCVITVIDRLEVELDLWCSCVKPVVGKLEVMEHMEKIINNWAGQSEGENELYFYYYYYKLMKYINCIRLIWANK